MDPPSGASPLTSSESSIYASRRGRANKGDHHRTSVASPPFPVNFSSTGFPLRLHLLYFCFLEFLSIVQIASHFSLPANFAHLLVSSHIFRSGLEHGYVVRTRNVLASVSPPSARSSTVPRVLVNYDSRHLQSAKRPARQIGIPFSVSFS